MSIFGLHIRGLSKPQPWRRANVVGFAFGLIPIPFPGIHSASWNPKKNQWEHHSTMFVIWWLCWWYIEKEKP